MIRFAAVFFVWAAYLGAPVLCERGKGVFTANCVPCHGQDGKAHTPAGRKLRAKGLTQSKLTAGEIRRQVNECHKDQRGVVMPPYKDVLKPDQIDAVVAFVKSLREKCEFERGVFPGPQFPRIGGRRDGIPRYRLIVLLPFLHQNLALDGSGPIAKSPSRV